MKRVSRLADILKSNPYPGRGIILGCSPDGKNALCAYFIMGRSANSRNRVFVKDGDELLIKPFDESLVEDPSLIIYRPVRSFQNKLVVTNGDQTDTVIDGLKQGKTFENALFTRTYEPDAPNYTPRISGIITLEEEGFSYELSILKRGMGGACQRFFYNYEMVPGTGHFIHTYAGDGNPLPSFEGEPKIVAIPDNIDAFRDELWYNLNGENKISLYVRYTSFDGAYQDRIVNKNVQEAP